MRSPRLILLLGFGIFVILTGWLALSAFWRAEKIFKDLTEIQNSYQRRAAILNAIQTDIYGAALLMRDHLIDLQAASGVQYRDDFVQMHASMAEHLSELSALMETRGALDRLQKEIDTYWNSMEPIFSWTSQQKAELGYAFLRNQVRPRRQSMIKLTQEIDQLNADGLQREERTLSESQTAFRRYLGAMSAVALSLAILVAGVSFIHMSRLERRSQNERQRTEHAERELRFLSQKLVHAQEEERRSISRELHDEIGQMLTGLRLELRNLEELFLSPGPDSQKRLQEIKDLAEKTMRAVRDLAMGLRPSMLDDLGLAPAIQWQAREYSRHNGVPATVEIDGNIDNIPEDVRTCIYRVVQESLTNCARHSRAENVRITLHGTRTDLVVCIQDDGIGFDMRKASSRGIGLIGMEERVRELGGRSAIQSHPGRGTSVDISVPITGKQV